MADPEGCSRAPHTAACGGRSAVAVPSQQAQMGPTWATFGASGHMWAWASSGLICGLHMGPIWAAHVFFIFLLDDIRYAWEPLKPWNCCNFLQK